MITFIGMIVAFLVGVYFEQKFGEKIVINLEGLYEKAKTDVKNLEDRF